jgi:hypothetical protein
MQTGHHHQTGVYSRRHQQEDVVIVNISRNKLNMGGRHFGVMTCYYPYPPQAE